MITRRDETVKVLRGRHFLIGSSEVRYQEGRANRAVLRERLLGGYRGFRRVRDDRGEGPSNLLYMAIASNERGPEGQLRGQLKREVRAVSPGAAGTTGLTNGPEAIS